jgi:hypothetical protein
MGYSTGKWDGDTLVVDTAGFNDKGWLDARGHPRSEALHVQERFHRRDFGHMDVEATVEIPTSSPSPSRSGSPNCWFPTVMFWRISAQRVRGNGRTCPQRLSNQRQPVVQPGRLRTGR